MVPPYAVDSSSAYTNLGNAAVSSPPRLFPNAQHSNPIGTPWIDVDYMLQHDLPWGDCFTCFTGGTAQLLLQPTGGVNGDDDHRWIQSSGLLPRPHASSANMDKCGDRSSDGFAPVVGTPVTWKQVLDRAPRRLAENNAQLLASVNKTAAYFKQISQFDWNALYGMNQDLGYPLQGCNNHTPAGIQPAPPVQEPGHMRAALHAQGLL
jgi:hypothetical protein